MSQLSRDQMSRNVRRLSSGTFCLFNPLLLIVFLFIVIVWQQTTRMYITVNHWIESRRDVGVHTYHQRRINVSFPDYTRRTEGRRYKEQCGLHSC